MAHQWTKQQRIQRGIWAVAFSACIFVGTITGAQLKTDKEKEEVGSFLILLFIFWRWTGHMLTCST